MGIGTKCVQDGYRPGNGEPRQVPIVQSTTFKYKSSQEMGMLFDLEKSGYFYTRLQNPTNDHVAAKIASLEGGTAAMLTSSGQAANFYAVFNIASAGDHVVASSAIYGGTYNLFAVTMKRMGIEFTFVPPHATAEELDAAFRPETKAVFGETIANPALTVLDIEAFGCKYAYTVDGGPVGELEWECFNAAEATVRFEGQSIHPGDAKGRMVNAGNLFCDFNALLPYAQRPEYTEGYEGFYHLEGVSATVDHATARYIVRDHDAAKFQQKLALIESAAALLNQRLGEELVTVEIKHQYRNMAEIVRDYPELIDIAKKAYLTCGIEPQVLPIRGGTDGAQLSFRGLPCPNLSTGGYCYHGVNEFVPVSSLVKMTDVLQELVARFA